MLRKTASGIMLTLLLTSMLTLAFNIQPVKAEGGLAESPWPMFQHNPRHTGRSPFIGPSESPQTEILIGNKTINGIFGAPVIDFDGTLYLGARINYKSGLYAFTPNGTQKWFYETPSAGLKPPALLESAQTVYTFSNLEILAVNTESGSLKWKKSFAYIYDNLVVGDDGILYFTAGCHLPDDSYCIRLVGLDENGEQILSYDIGETGATPSCPTIDKEGTIYLGYNDTLFAINPNGTEKWRRTFEADLEYYASSRPTVTTPSIADDGTIYVVVFRQSDWRTALDQGFNNHLHAIDPENPSIDKWCRRYRYSYGFTSPEVPPAIDFDGNVYATSSYYVPGSGSHLLILVFTPEGNLKRSMELGGGFLLIDAENTVFSLGRLTPLAASLRIFDSEGNETVVNFPYQEGSRQPFLSLASDGTLYVGGHKTLYAVRRGESPWSQFQHDAQHTGKSTFLGPGTENIEAQVLIKGQTDNDYFGSPVIGADGTLYLTATINGRGGIFAFNSDGTEKWFYETYATLMLALSKSDETVYVLSDEGILAVNADNGELRWKRDFGGLLLDQKPVIGQDGIIYFIAVCTLPDDSYDVCLIAINKNGEVAWAYAIEKDETYYDFELPEEQPTGYGYGVPITMPTIDKEGTIYFGYQLYTLYAINPNGTTKWQRSIEGHCTPSVADDGTIYLITSVMDSSGPDGTRNGLLAIDPKNPLEDKWSHHTGGFPQGPPAIDSNGNVYLPVWYQSSALWYGDPAVYIYTPEGNVKNLLWLERLWSGSIGLPLIDAENNVYVLVDWMLNILDSEGNLISITLPTDYREQLSYTLSLGSDGTLYIGGGNLYAVKSSISPPLYQPPTASFSYSPYNPIIGEQITFDASNSYDPDGGTITNYRWEFYRLTDSIIFPPIEIIEGADKVIVHHSFSLGDYLVVLIVTDDEGATSSTAETVKVWEKWSFAFITDLHIGGLHLKGGPPLFDYESLDYGSPCWSLDESGPEYATTEYLRETVRNINSLTDVYNIAFVVVGGDFADSAEISEFNKAIEILKDLEVPWIPIIGNHDIWPYCTWSERYSGDTPDEYFHKAFKALYQKLATEVFPDTWDKQSTPVQGPNGKQYYFQNFAFDYKGHHFVCLDFNSRDLMFPPELPVPPEQAGVQPWAHLYDFKGGTWNWFKEHIKDYPKKGNENMIIFSHHPMRYCPGKAFSALDDEKIEDYIQTNNLGNTIWGNFGGHTHQNSEWFDYETDMYIIETDATLKAPLTRIVQVYYNGTIDYSILEYGPVDIWPSESSDWRDSKLQPGDILYDSSSLGGLGHVGIYVGNGMVTEAQLEGVKRNSVETWDYPNRDNVYILRVRCSDEIKEAAVSFAEAQVGKPYDMKWWQKDPDPNSPSWYCSELIWAAYYNQGTDIEGTPDSWAVTPYEIFADDDTFVVGGHIIDGKAKEGIGILADCHVDLVITDPDGLTVSKELNEIPGALYVEDDFNEDGVPDDFIAIPERKTGDYLITVIPEPDAEPTETYTLEVSANYTTIILAENVPIHNIPVQPYILRSTKTDIIPIIHATIDLDPDTLNLKSKGQWVTVYIELPVGHGYNVTDINPGCIMLNGQVQAEAKPIEIGDYDGDGIPDLMVKFNRTAVQAILEVGEKVEITISGELIDGRQFEGKDTTKVILPP